jgi:hypothetical protein
MSSSADWSTVTWDLTWDLTRDLTRDATHLPWFALVAFGACWLEHSAVRSRRSPAAEDLAQAAGRVDECRMIGDGPDVEPTG